MRYKIANLTVEMDAFGRTFEQAQPYAVSDDGPVDIQISCDIDKLMEANPHVEDPDMMHYIASGFMFSRKILDFDGYYLHSSAVVLDGKAYLFSAPSGTGKSTHTRKWCRLFGARYLNDDKPVLRLENGIWMAYGTPWSGKDDLSSNEGVPLGGIAWLQRGEVNSIAPMAPAKALPQLMGQSNIRLTRDEVEKKLDLLGKLLQQVPVWELYCRNDDEAAYVSHDAMTR